MKDQRHHETPASIFIHAGQNHTWEILQQCASASLQQIGQDITLAIQNLFSAPALVNDVNDQIKIMTLVARKYRNHSMLPAYRFHTIVFVVLHCLAICTLGEEPKHGLLRFENILCCQTCYVPFTRADSNLPPNMQGKIGALSNLIRWRSHHQEKKHAFESVRPCKPV